MDKKVMDIPYLDEGQEGVRQVALGYFAEKDKETKKLKEELSVANDFVEGFSQFGLKELIENRKLNELWQKKFDWLRKELNMRFPDSLGDAYSKMKVREEIFKEAQNKQLKDFEVEE